MSDCSTVDEAYETGIDSLIKDIHALQDENNALEQRYQQLKQVAKEMYWDVSNSLYDGFETVNKYRQPLEALGVSLDD